MIYLGKSSTSLTVLSIFFLNQMNYINHTSRSEYRLNHLPYKSELTQSPINSIFQIELVIELICFHNWILNWVKKEQNEFDLCSEKNENVQIIQLNRVDWCTNPGDSAGLCCVWLCVLVSFFFWHSWTYMQWNSVSIQCCLRHLTRAWQAFNPALVLPQHDWQGATFCSPPLRNRKRLVPLTKLLRRSIDLENLFLET